MYIQCNTEARSCNHCCSGKEIIIIYPESVFVALVIQHEKHMHHIVICCLPGCSVILNIISKMAGFLKKNVIEHEMCFLILSTNLSETFLIFRRTER